MSLTKSIRSMCGLLLCVITFGVCSAETDDPPVHMVFTSDPQFPWTESSDNDWDESTSDKEKVSRQLIEAQYSNIADFRNKITYDPARVPVMINGDMTAFGHGSERSTTKSILDKHLGGLYDYGLGNHDYENNVNDCFLNNCATGSIVDFKDRYWGKLNTLDLRSSDSGTIKKGLFGSLAYSKIFGDVQVVQLHNEPTYSTNFTAYNWAVPTGYYISDSLDWLEQNLKVARNNRKIIVLNMHKPDRWQGSTEQIARFKAMIEKYEVTAVFAGHLHNSSGRYTGWNRRDYFGDVPVFLSGGASSQTYLIASFARDRKKLTVHQVNGNDWRGRKEIETIDVR